ncbi:hypothetical protein PRK78_004796 [Emydomyces testavorans]|uniref:Extracellular mutant protein 11 C-terminal domain-containing protein n=1 Tax=Emydomyces testavorans TaxID=2070801 RepID=A0AAF0DIC2_9EURO|nr:hypothetical protein PRK78_004796 [Emydomyces testavorans]
MKLSDYVRGMIPQSNERPVSQDTSKSSVPSSRLRAAELARVNVPPTRLNGISMSSTFNANGKQQRQALQAVGDQRADHRDMFDTDVEGIDDSTTTMSVIRDEDAVTSAPAKEERLASPRRAWENAHHHHDVPLDAFRGAFEQRNYTSVAERMKELDSDADDEVRGVSQAQYHYFETRANERNAGPDMEPEKEPTMKLSHVKNQGSMNWQQIEAALREHDGPPANTTSSSGQTSGCSPMRQVERQLQSPAVNEPEQAGYSNTIHTTPRPIRKLVPSGRFTPKSRFATPKPQKPPTPFSISRIPRPASASGIPFASDQTLSPLNPEYHRAALPPSPSQTGTNNDEYHSNQGGMFDTTDLSVLDSSDGSTTEAHAPPTTTSPQLSTLSPVSSKRPFTAFTSDYHPNILQSKSFSDLHAEPFDYNPAPPPPVFPPQDPELPLSEKLQRLKSLTDDQRRTFFSSLTLVEWEDSGDWLIEQFGVVLQKTKDARRERRQVAAVFDEEIKRRYELVEGEVKGIRERMDDMRAGGMGVLKGREQ